MAVTNSSGYIMEVKDISSSVLHQTSYVHRTPASLAALGGGVSAIMTPTYLLNNAITVGSGQVGGYDVHLPTGTDMSAALPGVQVGDVVRVVITNAVAQVATIIAGVDFTIVGTATITAAAGYMTELVMKCTAAHTWVCFLSKN